MESEATCPDYPSFMDYLHNQPLKPPLMNMEIKHSTTSLSFWFYMQYFLFRPLFALLFVLFILAAAWWVAWKTVLVHVPLMQEIFGLRKKPPRPPPPERRYTKYYNSLNAARNSAPSPS